MGIKMAIRAFGSALFKITSEKILGKDVIRGGESNKPLYFNDYLKSAEISFPTRNRLCLVQYREFQALTASGVDNFVSIEMIQPIKFCAMELGLYAQLRCKEALCLHIEKVYFSKVYTGLKMLTGTVAEATCTINRRYDYKVEKIDGFYISSSGVIATISSPLLNKKITVLFNGSGMFTNSGLSCFAKINVINPFKLEITEYGVRAELLCLQKLSQEVEKVYLQKQLSSNSHDPA